MFDHVSIGVRDLARARQFYDAALRPLGYACLSEGADALGYGRDKIALWIGKAARPVPPDPGSNLHFCFAAPTREAVDGFHAAALSAGGTDNGAPGLRPDYGAGYSLPSRSTPMGIASRPTAAVRGALAAPNPCCSRGRIDYRTIKDGPPSTPKRLLTSACTNAGPCA
jgi:catechol 2,3-dioxygenase-like lactoylglutathione lyase family enzyme